MQNLTNSVKSLLDFAKQRLAPLYPAQEVQALCHVLFSEIFGMTPAMLYISLEKMVDANLVTRLEKAVEQLQQMRPIQQIFGKTEFYGLPFTVSEHTLIPRPETEELVEWIISDFRFQISDSGFKNQKSKILDIGTGSGCIAISLAKNIPQSEVFACDISEEALTVAQKNAAHNEVEVMFEKVNILDNSKFKIQDSRFDIIVSNPPYVCESEKAEMSANVLLFEPHSALFVEDGNPLIFYSAIADFAKKTLSKDGFLYFEINAKFGKEVEEMLRVKGFSNLVLKKDINGKDRMVRAQNT